MESKPKKTALLAGATGLVGRQILQLLANDEEIAEVRALVRRPLPAEDRRPRVRECIVNFDRLEEHPEWFNVDLVFSALGTTIGAAGSQAAFRRVDFEYAFSVAKLARAAGARQFLFVSAMGANAHSMLFYNRVKGELEEAVKQLGYPSIAIARPSLLLGKRSTPRLSEEVFKRFGWIAPKAFAPIEAAQVAAALVRASKENTPGVKILDNRKLHTVT